MMTDWYYHDPAQGRVGPLTDDDLRVRYRDRRIQLDTLVWHADLREWQPLQRFAEDLNLHTVTPDSSLPPPLPPQMPLRMQAATGASIANAARTAAPRKADKSGCLIAAIVIGVGGLVVVGILAAVALPAYQDYLARAKRAQAGEARGIVEYDADAIADTDEKVRAVLERAMAVAAEHQQPCPDQYEFDSVLVRDPDLTGQYTIDAAEFAPGRCAYHVNFPGSGGKPLRYDVVPSADGVSVTCTASGLPAQLRPPDCD